MLNSNFLWVAVVSAGLGFMRCFIQTPLPLVIAEEYPSRFATAFSLYMVVCGLISLICGPLIGIHRTFFRLLHLFECLIFRLHKSGNS